MGFRTLYFGTLLLLLVRPITTSSVADRGSFLSPHTGVKWRYWIEDASTDLDVLRSDVAEMARVGSAGFELLSYQSYGGLLNGTGDTILDPTDFAFGSDRFVTVTAAIVQAAVQHNLTIDFTLGPNQGAGIPVYPEDVDTEGMCTELVFGTYFLDAGEVFNGPLPPPTIIPTLTRNGDIANANTTDMKLIGVIGAQLAPGANSSSSRVSLDFNTVQDLTNQVQGTENAWTISWTAPSNGSSVLLTYFSHRNGFPEARPGLHGAEADKPGSWGSWVVDHFSPKGVNISSSFIEKNILARDDIGALLAQPGVGQYLWEDSMEFKVQLFWTDILPERFLERHGYEVNIALPVLYSLPTSFVTLIPNQTFDYGDTTNWGKFTEDYQDTLTSLYMDYMSAWSEWSKSVGMTYSNQPGYNFRLDTAASAAIPDTPEIESLGVPSIDQARQLSGGVHLGNHAIFSSETGARIYEADAIRMVELLEDAKTQYAAGVNVVMLHGFPYSGYYPNTTWPGITTFGYNFADMHGPRQPAWDHYREYLDFLARTQYLLQAGVAKVDLAIYRKDYNIVPSPPFAGTSLISAGYSYEYVSPENLKLPGISVSNGRLAPAGPAYKAFILNHQANITVDAAQRLLQYAQSGLPVVISGVAPSDIPGFEINGTGKAQVQALMSQLVSQSNVILVDGEDEVPAALADLGVVPAVSLSPTSDALYSVVRQEEHTSHFYLYNQELDTINFTLTLNPGFNGTPFALDPWTGDVTPVALYTEGEQGISIPGVSLASNQSVLFSITTLSSFEGVSAPSSHLTSVDDDLIAVFTSNGSVELRSSSEGAKKFTIDSGLPQTANLSLEGASTITLDGWQLNITAWTPPQNLSDPRSVLVPQPTFNLTGGLVPWDELDEQENTSGVGTYVTSFGWDHAEDSGVGVKLDFGEVFHTIKAWVNGVQIPTADPTNPVVDISSFVRQGTNEIRVDVASTLLNVINSVPEVTTLGDVRTPLPAANQHYGLIADVRLVPYARTTITL